MISITVVFWMFVLLFAIIGGMRGWARELLVAFSVILALTLITLLENYIPFIRDVLKKDSKSLYFWLRFLIIGLLVFFGYQTPNIARFAPKMNREKIQDTLLGVILGALNGYLIVGTLWYFMFDAGYPIKPIQAPPVGTEIEKIALAMLKYMPPKILGVPGIYFAVVVAFIFVIVVFI
jgi:uncharacterized membrane protein required for colicin V production